MIRLAISTSDSRPSAAVFEGEALLALCAGADARTHSETILPLVEQALAKADAPVRAVEEFAVDIGPGSFTGVRIGVSLANAMAAALNKPVVGISSLNALCFGRAGSVCALLDCRNGNGYALHVRDGQIVLPESAIVIAELLPSLPDGTLFIGSGAALHRDAILSALPHARFIDENIVSAEQVGRAAFGKAAAAEALPLYLRPSQAERLYKG
ncbi:MAG: tRNA (adenosine(37)-N6)-threonylcarbamoyltransferase complex dimerization subunit type 1 TsaB [Christensenellaceae bacterium]|jgi:tRNA threonylcarbamoyladenosine biosynthesis protein TsaB|nr:tRNA (adenosine(37)-N6)-threonylcarbamoyltransferase complex dimerization subunit type 1 TsaB [Christensenellaceae bacterium]